MDDLEQQNKIPLNSFSGISFTPLSSAPTSPGKTSSDLPLTASAPVTENTSNSDSSNLLGRLGAKPDSSLGVPARHNPLSRINQHKPRSSSPLASAPTNAEPESPPAYGSGKPAAPASAPAPAAAGFFSISTTPAASKTPAGKPPATSIFSNLGSKTSAPAPPLNLFGSVNAPKKDSPGLGLGKPTSEPVKQADSGSVPNFFGKSQPGSGAATPSASAPAPTINAFNFGASAPTPPPAPLQGSADAAKKPFAGFNFGTSATSKPAEAAPTTGSLVSCPGVMSETNAYGSFLNLLMPLLSSASRRLRLKSQRLLPMLSHLVKHRPQLRFPLQTLRNRLSTLDQSLRRLRPNRRKRASRLVRLQPRLLR